MTGEKYPPNKSSFEETSSLITHTLQQTCEKCAS